MYKRLKERIELTFSKANLLVRREEDADRSLKLDALTRKPAERTDIHCEDTLHVLRAARVDLAVLPLPRVEGLHGPLVHLAGHDVVVGDEEQTR